MSLNEELWRAKNTPKGDGSLPTYEEIGTAFGMNGEKARGRIRRYITKMEQGEVEESPVISINETHISENLIHLSAKVEGQIVSPEDLCKAANIDMGVWQIGPEPTLKKWNGIAKNIKKDLTFDEGKITGTLTQDGITMAQMFSVSVKLLRIEPIEIMPVIKPVRIALPKASRAKKISGLDSALIISDAHIGFSRNLLTGKLTSFHDRGVLGIALELARTYKFTEIIFLGDNLDLAEWSTKFLVNPEFLKTTQPALIEFAWWLAQFRAEQPDADIVVFDGNHEKRVSTMLATHAQAAYGLVGVGGEYPALSLPNLLGFDELDIKYINNYPDGRLWLNENTLVSHGDIARGGSTDTAKAMVNKHNYTTVSGHIHRRELASKKIETPDGYKIHTAVCFGCACKIDGSLPGSGISQQWQKGLGIVKYTKTTQQAIPIFIDKDSGIYDDVEWSVNEDIDSEIDKMLMDELIKMDERLVSVG